MQQANKQSQDDTKQAQDTGAKLGADQAAKDATDQANKAATDGAKSGSDKGAADGKKMGQDKGAADSSKNASDKSGGDLNAYVLPANTSTRSTAAQSATKDQFLNEWGLRRPRKSESDDDGE
jgi:hypothetical protein